ncbi:hypothetical protein ACFU53_10825 [Streptomyces sp. NPDC057474]|uniref:hypothetical protein n=1 Tax=Streptomyces sp. NPDC057474 TaxID=3346144 RepID=UPI003676BD45
MRDLPPGPVRLQLFLGPAVPVAAPKFVLDSLTGLKVESGSGDAQSGFELTFSIPKDSPVQAFFPISVPVFRCVVAVTVRGVTEVLVDGVITHQDMTAAGPTSVLHVKGKDLTYVMDLVPFDGLPFPAMSPAVRALTLLSKYVALGCAPVVIPSLLEDVPIPVDQIPTQQGTDYAYLTALAKEVGHVFYIDPGPVPGVSKAYWGPEVRLGAPQPALNIGLDGAHDNVATLNFTFDKEKRELPIVAIQERVSKAPVNLPIPDIAPIRPPLGLVPPLPPKLHHMNDTAKLSPLAAVMKGIAYAAQHSDAVFATGTLDVAKYGHVLRSRRLVGVRGAGMAFDGLYYVTRVTHDIKRGAYTQAFSLARNGVVSTVPAVPV